MSDTLAAEDQAALAEINGTTEPVEKPKSIFDMFGTDAEREKRGVIFEYADVKIRVARAGGANTKFMRLTAQKMLPLRRLLQSQQNKMDDHTLAMLRKIQIEVFADTVVLGWDGIFDRSGAAILFSKENALSLLTQLPDLFDALATFAQDMSNFQGGLDENDAKN